MFPGLLLTLPMMVCSPCCEPAEPAAMKLRVLIVDGHNPYHEWQVTSPLLKRMLEESGRFEVDVATVPIPAGFESTPNAMPPANHVSDFRPRFANYDVVLGNYAGQRWPQETERDFVSFVAGGGGFVTVHAANNAFPTWPEYTRMCGLGGWQDRTPAWGPYVYYNDAGRLVRDESPGPTGHHGPLHEYQVRLRDTSHPITRGLPRLWMHTKDELYDSLRGPAEAMHVLATAYAAPDQQGTGRHEPMLMTLTYGGGRIFHTVLGHADYSMRCVGFVTTLLRGTEWAATGQVTIGLPSNFPTADEALAWDGRPLDDLKPAPVASVARVVIDNRPPTRSKYASRKLRPGSSGR